MRYLAVGLAVALLVVVPAAVAGPDALSLAKRALRLAKEPPKVVQIHTSESTPSGESAFFRVRCPRGMVAAGIASEEPTRYESIQGRRAFVVISQQPTIGPKSGITVTCVEGRLR